MSLIWERQATEIQELLVMGRSLVNPQGIRLFWPLSGIRFAYSGTMLRCGICCSYQAFPLYAAVLVDHNLVLRFPLEQGTHMYTVLIGMDMDLHEIEIVRETQPIMDDPGSTFYITSLEGNGTISAPQCPRFHLEFIGDSLTCGEGTVGAPGNQEWHPLYLSPSNGYMQMVTSALKAECHVVAEGGWGLFSDWKGTQEHNIPGIYERLCALSRDGDHPYDFLWQPDAVIINLGTNDTSACQLLSSGDRLSRLKALETEAVAFLNQIRKRYPSAYLLWIYGMCGQTLAGVFRSAVGRAKKEGIDNIGFLRLSECSREEMGSRQHPGVKAHMKAAERILSVLENKDIYIEKHVKKRDKKPENQEEKAEG